MYADLFDVLQNRMYADPVLLGRYPELPDQLPGQIRDKFAFLEAVEPSDLEVMSRPLDFYGLNYYLPTRIRAGAPASSATPDGRADAMRGLPFSLVDWPEFATTGFGWPVAPGYLTVALRELAERYGDALPPVYITEGGASFPDTVADDGSVEDPRRTAYLADHLAAAFEGANGVDVRGYFVWSLLDNWEWAAGFTQRFGLVRVDEHTQDRTPKASYRWLRSLLRSR
jgi:beta-glucosidase